MRILWASGAPWAKKSSGFANQTSKILPCLAALGHQIGLFAWHGLEGGAMQTVLEGGYPLTIFPKGADRFGNDMVAAHARAFAALGVDVQVGDEYSNGTITFLITGAPDTSQGYQRIPAALK